MHLALSCNRPHRVWSVTGIFHAREVGMACRGYCNEADFMEIFKFPEILGWGGGGACGNMGLFSVTTDELGDEANHHGYLLKLASMDKL